MHRPRKFLTSTSKYLQNFRALIQESLILVTHMLMLLNGKKKLRILLQDSLRTSLNMKEMLLVKHLYLLDRRLKCKIRRWMWESFSCIHFFVYTMSQVQICAWRMYIIELSSEMVYKVYQSSRRQLTRLCEGTRERLQSPLPLVFQDKTEWNDL